MEQLPEIILIDDVLHTLYTTPLQSWLRGQDDPPAFDQRMPSCNRGYVGCWKISDGVLWLIGLHAVGEQRRPPSRFAKMRRIPAT